MKLEALEWWVIPGEGVLFLEAVFLVRAIMLEVLGEELQIVWSLGDLVADFT